MLKIFLLAALLFFCLFLQNCNSKTSENIQSKVEIDSIPQLTETPQKQDNKIQLPTTGNVEFKGVSFNYKPQIFGKVAAEEVDEYALQEEKDKPDGVEPQHCLFTFDLLSDFGEMYIAVYPIDDFPRMYAVNKSSVESMEEEIKNLKKVLKDKKFRVENQIPYLRFIDASQTFQAKVKHFNFLSGKGILFLTFWETQLEFPSNRQLQYVFEGLTNDGKYYVLAEMPISVAFLPEDSSEKYEGYKIPWGEKNFDREIVLKQMTEVSKKVAKRLENLPGNEFNPNLKYFEEIISSLKIEK